MAVVHYLAALSGALPLKNLFASLEDMARAFNPFALGRGNAVMNMEELRSLSARYFRAADPQMQVTALGQAVDGRRHVAQPRQALRLDLVTGLRDNAQSIHELRDVLPHFTADRIRYDETALHRAGLRCKRPRSPFRGTGKHRTRSTADRAAGKRDPQAHGPAVRDQGPRPCTIPSAWA